MGSLLVYGVPPGLWGPSFFGAFFFVVLSLTDSGQAHGRSLVLTHGLEDLGQVWVVADHRRTGPAEVWGDRTIEVHQASQGLHGLEGENQVPVLRHRGTSVIL